MQTARRSSSPNGRPRNDCRRFVDNATNRRDTALLDVARSVTSAGTGSNVPAYRRVDTPAATAASVCSSSGSVAAAHWKLARGTSPAALRTRSRGAGALASGGDDPDIVLPLRALIWTGIAGYPAARVDHRFKDGDTIRLGPVAVTAHAHVTGGHTRGCTSWSFKVRDGERDLNVVSVCSLVVLEILQYPGQRGDFERTFRVLRSLPADIWVTEHARLFGRYRKFVARETAKNPPDPFIDPGATAPTSTTQRQSSGKGECISSLVLYMDY